MKLVKFVSAAILVFIPLYLLLLLLKFRQYVYPETEPPGQGVVEEFSGNRSLVRFRTSDGVSLAGEYLESSQESRRGVIIMGHGHGETRQSMHLPASDLLHRSFDIFLIDFRAHGDSRGEWSGLGGVEWRDVRAARAYVLARMGQRKTVVGYYGRSMGAVAALLAADTDTLFDFLILEAPYSTLTDSVRRHIKREFRFRMPFAYKIADYYYNYLTGLHFYYVNPFTKMYLYRTKPVLLLYGEKDDVAPVEDAVLFQEQNPGADLVMIRGVGHEHLYKYRRKEILGWVERTSIMTQMEQGLADK